MSMGNTFTMNLEYNEKSYQINVPQVDYPSIIQYIKSQLGIQQEYKYFFIFFLLDSPQDLKVQIKNGMKNSIQKIKKIFHNFNKLYQQNKLQCNCQFDSISQQKGVQQFIQEEQVYKNFQYLLEKGLYLKYFRLKQRTIQQDPKLAEKLDPNDNKFVDIHIYGLKYYAQYNFMNKEFLKFLYCVINHEKCNYGWINDQAKEFFLLRSIEIFDYEDKFQKERKNIIQFEIIRQNRVKLYCHYYFFAQICQRYQMEAYQKLLNNQLLLTEPNYQKCVFQLISSFIGVNEYQLDQQKISAINEYFKPFSQPKYQCKATFLQQIQTIVQKINYEPPTFDHNPNIGFSLDENIRIEDALYQLTNKWTHNGPFYDIHLTKQALYDAKYIIYLYDKYSRKNLDTIIKSVNFQLVQN